MKKPSSVPCSPRLASSQSISSSNSISSARFTQRPPTTDTSAKSMILTLRGKRRTRRTRSSRLSDKTPNTFMSTTIAESKTKQDYKVADISLADFGRKGNAGSHSDPGEICAAETARRGAHHRLVAHDNSDGGFDRDTYRPWRECALGELQHFLYARSCRSGNREERHLCFRVERRIARGLLVVHLSRDFPSGWQRSATGGR